MPDLKYAKRFEDLLVYQRALYIAREIFVVSKKFPREEAYSLTSQIRRSSRAVGAQIAEAWGKRRYPRHFIAKLTDADAEQLETRHWLGIATACGYLTTNHERDLVAACAEVGRLLHGMMRSADRFCGDPRIEDEPASYLGRLDPADPLVTDYCFSGY